MPSDRDAVEVSRGLPLSHAIILGLLTAVVAVEGVGMEWPIHVLAAPFSIGMIVGIHEMVSHVGE